MSWNNNKISVPDCISYHGKCFLTSVSQKKKDLGAKHICLLIRERHKQKLIYTSSAVLQEPSYISRYSNLTTDQITEGGYFGSPKGWWVCCAARRPDRFSFQKINLTTHEESKIWTFWHKWECSSMEKVVYNLSENSNVRTLMTFLLCRSVIFLFFDSPLYLYCYIAHLLWFANIFARNNYWIWIINIDSTRKNCYHLHIFYYRHVYSSVYLSII